MEDSAGTHAMPPDPVMNMEDNVRSFAGQCGDTASATFEISHSHPRFRDGRIGRSGMQLGV